MMHRDLIFQYMEIQALVLSVIVPHWSEYIWLEILYSLHPTPPSRSACGVLVYEADSAWAEQGLISLKPSGR